MEKYASKIMNMVALYVKLLIQMSYMGKRFLCHRFITHRGIIQFFFPHLRISSEKLQTTKKEDYCHVLVGNL